MKTAAFIQTILLALSMYLAIPARADIALSIRELPSGQTQWEITSSTTNTLLGTPSNVDFSILLDPGLFVSPFINQSFSFSAPLGIARNIDNPQSNSLSLVGDSSGSSGFSPYILAVGPVITASPGELLAITNTAAVTSPILFSNIVTGPHSFNGGFWGPVEVTTVPLPEPNSMALLLLLGGGLFSFLFIRQRKARKSI
jgi:hypothetical protein